MKLSCLYLSVSKKSFYRISFLVLWLNTMSDFVGLVVLVTLANGQVVEGRIEAVAPEANLMLLCNAGTN